MAELVMSTFLVQNSTMLNRSYSKIEKTHYFKCDNYILITLCMFYIDCNPRVFIHVLRAVRDFFRSVLVYEIVFELFI